MSWYEHPWCWPMKWLTPLSKLCTAYHILTEHPCILKHSIYQHFVGLNLSAFLHTFPCSILTYCSSKWYEDCKHWSFENIVSTQSTIFCCSTKIHTNWKNKKIPQRLSGDKNAFIFLVKFYKTRTELQPSTYYNTIKNWSC